MRKYLWILVVLVVGAAVYFWGGNWAGKYAGVVLTSSSPSSSPAKGTAAKSAAKASPAPVSAKAYTDAVKEYEGRRIQFDDRCQITPQSPTYKNGTSIMLDNRSASTRTITVDGAKYDLAAYGYRIITLSSSSLPKTLSVSCGSSNVGKILLQAQILQ